MLKRGWRRPVWEAQLLCCFRFRAEEGKSHLHSPQQRPRKQSALGRQKIDLEAGYHGFLSQLGKVSVFSVECGLC